MSDNSTDEAAAQGPRRGRGGGRAGNTRRQGSAIIEQMTWRLTENTDRPTEPLTEEGVLAIHDGAMRVLEEIGIEFLMRTPGSQQTNDLLKYFKKFMGDLERIYKVKFWVKD